MISLVRRIPGNFRSSVSLLDNMCPVKGLAAISNRYISTSETAQNSVQNISKSGQRVGGLPMDLINKGLLQKSSRTLSTLQNQSVFTAEETRDFMAILPEIVRDLREITSKYNPIEVSDWFARVLEYNLREGKQYCGLLSVSIYKSLVKSNDLKPENIRLANILGWCIEMLTAFFEINDDVMDHSITRRGQLCWYKVKGVGLGAINDAVLIENAVYSLLKKYFRNTGCYVELMELFRKMTFLTTCGQNLDLLNAEKPVTTFTMEKYNAIGANKATHLFCSLPLLAAMHLAGIKDAEAFCQSKTILLEIGNMIQMKNDFLDCFGDPKITGKIGTDIKDNKFSWLAVMCMQRANEEQKQIMLDCYGQNDPEKVQKVKELYKSLDLPNTYAVYEEQSYNMIKTHIEQMSHGGPHEVLSHILNIYYKRDV